MFKFLAPILLSTISSLYRSTYYPLFYFSVLYSSTISSPRQKATPATMVTSNNLTIPSTLPFIDLTKLLQGRDNSASNNRVEETGRGLDKDVEWFQPGSIKNQLENIDVDPLALNTQLFKGDTNALESEERTTAKATFDPNDPFSIYSFREHEETVKTTTKRATTSRTPREAPRGFTSRQPSTDYWIWEDDFSHRNSKPYYPISFPSSFPRFLARDKGLATEKY